MTADFIRVACPSCEHDQLFFERAATQINCDDCGEILAEPAGGAADLHGTPVEAVKQR